MNWKARRLAARPRVDLAQQPVEDLRIDPDPAGRRIIGKARAAVNVRVPRVQKETTWPFAAANADHGHGVIPRPARVAEAIGIAIELESLIAADDDRVAV